MLLPGAALNLIFSRLFILAMLPPGGGPELSFLKAVYPCNATAGGGPHPTRACARPTFPRRGKQVIRRYNV